MHKALSILLFCFLFLWGTSNAWAQGEEAPIDSSLLKLEERAVAGETSEIRTSAFDSLTSWVMDTLSRPGGWSTDLSTLRSLAVIAPADASFRIVTAQLQESVDQFRHFGVVQFRDRDSVISLVDREVLDPWVDFSAEQWRGALYYDMRSFLDDQGQASYLLFGFDGYSVSANRKVIDVLQISTEGKVSFAEGAFVGGPGEESGRVELIYSADIPVRLNYDEEMELVIFDHLIPMPSRYQKGKMAMVSDGSYEGYTLDKGKWKYVEKVFHQISDAPPGEGLPSERKKLFAKPGDKN